jgi:hypothetical protein
MGNRCASSRWQPIAAVTLREIRLLLRRCSYITVRCLRKDRVARAIVGRHRPPCCSRYSVVRFDYRSPPRLRLESVIVNNFGARQHIRAARVDHREDRRSSARRRMPRHVSPARVWLRCLLAGRVRGNLRAVWTGDRLRAIAGLSFERLEEAAGQPRRST